MKTFKYLLFLLLIFTIGFCIYVAVQPNSFEVSRTRTINAPASVIYNNVIDFKNWEAWSSWAEENPKMKIYLSEQTKGVNGSFSWEDKDGVGTMKTIKAVPNTSIEQDMQIEGFPSSNVNWSFKPNNDGSTNVTWNISGKDLSFGFKIFSILTGGMDKQIGPHYERSLIKLDSIVVANMKKYSITIDGITEHSGGYYIFNSTSCKISDIKNKASELFARLKNYVEENNITMAGSPFINYHYFDRENNATMLSCCIPTTARVITTENDILTGQLEPFKTLKTTLMGDYMNLQEAWETSMKYISENGLVASENGPMLETYVTDPSSSLNPADWKTEIYIALY